MLANIEAANKKREALKILPVLIALTLVCFALTPSARVVCQGGCLTNSNTALGRGCALEQRTGELQHGHRGAALSDNTTGYDNTATEGAALSNNTTGISNAATGEGVLLSATGQIAIYCINGGTLTPLPVVSGLSLSIQGIVAR